MVKIRNLIKKLLMGWFRVTFIETKSFGNIHAKNIVSHGLDKTKT